MKDLIITFGVFPALSAHLLALEPVSANHTQPTSPNVSFAGGIHPKGESDTQNGISPEAVSLYITAAKQGNAQAQFLCGLCYTSGLGAKK